MIQFCLELSKIESLSIIGLAVGDIEPLMKSARNTYLDKLYELAADLEMFKYQILKIMNHCCGRPFIPPLYLKRKNLKGKRRYIKKATELFESWTPGVHQVSSDDK